MTVTLWKNLSHDEKAYFGDDKTRALHQLFSHLAQSHLNESSYAAIKTIAEGFEKQSTLIAGGWWYDKMSFIGEVPTPQARSQFVTITASQLPTSDEQKRDHVFSVNLRDFSDNGTFVASRSLPVMFRLAHVEDRFEERKKEKSEFVDSTLYPAIALATVMCEIAEKKFKGRITPSRIPIVIPARNGLFLGELRQAPQGWSQNRLIINAPSSMGAIKTEPYKWHPRFNANIWTYIGSNEMRPDQQRLQSLLSGFFHPAKARLITSVFDGYLAVQSESLSDRIQNVREYEQVIKSLENIMFGKLWNSVVYLPKQNFRGLHHP